MGGAATPLTGPDLAEGIPLSRLDETSPLPGHIDGEAVLLVRRGDVVSAIGATCTHYGGPLADGLVVGNEVRCPWHHACFDLRTGEAVSAPALNPLPRWETEVTEGVVRLGRRIEEDPLSARDREPTGGASRVVIVGAGAAGSAAAEMLRREGHEGVIIMVDPDPDAPYDRPNLSKDYLAGSAPEEWIPLRPASFYEEHGIERRVARVEVIRREDAVIVLSTGEEVSYDALILATGAVPRTLDIPGVDLPHVHTLRSLEDCRRIIASAESTGDAVVIGASFIGMETAASLRARGLSVSVVAPDAVPFERALGPELGRVLQAAHERNGVALRLGRTVRSIAADRVELDDGSSLPAGLVVLGVGVRVDTRLAEAAGLRVGDGILVDRSLRTSDPRIWAAGDIARIEDDGGGGGVRIEHWVVAQRHGQSVARAILGRAQRPGEVPFFWTNQFDVGVSYVGHAAEWSEVRVDGDPSAGDATFRYVAGDRTLAVATLGRDRAALEAVEALSGAGEGRVRSGAPVAARGSAS